MADQRRVAEWLAQSVAELLGRPAAEVPLDEPFTGLGLSSLQVVELSDRLQRWAGVELAPTVAYDYPAIDDVAAHVARLTADGDAPDGDAPDRDAPRPGGDPLPVAIVGIGCRIPGADGPEELWRLLTEGVDAIREVPANRWDAASFYDPDTSAPGRMNTRWGGFLDDVEGFDAAFYGISAREAARMDPQQRVALEVAWEALEDAGVAAGTLAGSRTGVYLGVSTFDHGTALWGSFGATEPYDGTGGALSIVANRLSFCLDLRGPSMVVDTACSSSLVAVHLACQALRAGEADLALAGGVNVITSPRIALSFSQGGLMAADGRCKPFDHRADGYVRSEGAGVVVLKPLPQAVADGDRIYAVVLGSAVSQDGRTNGLTAPNGLAQEAVLRTAYRAAGLPPAEVGYVEAHGTGTAVGDPIEVAALGTVLGAGRAADRPLRVGSVKSNVGHLEAAAGVAGLIKTALALHHRLVPPTVHFEKPNPLLRLDRVPVTVVAGNETWPARPDGQPAPAGVSSFGFGGTNSHLVLAAAPRTRPDAGPAGGPDAGGAVRIPRLVPISARSRDALARRAAAWSAEARRHAQEPDWLARAAAAAARRVDHGPYRAAAVASSTGQLAGQLAGVAAGATSAGTAGPRRVARQEPKVALVFPGQGPQWAGMGRRLAAAVPAFRAAITEADAAVARHLGRSLWSDERGLVVTGTAEVQPALFAVQVALAATWRAWGLRPAAVIGHSMGEIAAAHVAGALSLDDAARVVCARSKLLTELSGLGGLALVELTADEAAALIEGREDELAVAALNGPRATVLSGSVAALSDVLERLGEQGVFARRIDVEFAAHSPQVEAVQPRLHAALGGLAPRDGDVALYSTVTGEPAAGRDLGPDYWVTNVRAPVRFGPALGRLLAAGYDTFVEVAPHPVLARPMQDHLEDGGHDEALVISTLRRDDELGSLLEAVGALYTAGGPVDWPALHPGTAVHTPLPGHGWQHQHFPIARLATAPPASRDGRRQTPGASRREGDAGLLGRRIPVGAEPALRLWELPLGLDTAPELAHHVVEGVPVVPGAYWLSAAVQAAGAVLGGTTVTLRDARFLHPCPLVDGQDPELQLTLRPDADGRPHFAVISCPPAGSPLTHAAGTVGPAGAAGEEPGAAGPAEQGTLAEIALRCATAVSVDAQYEHLERAGLRYGPRFRGIDRLTAGTGEALARVRLPDGLEAVGAPLHPALLDACLHTIAATTAEAGREGALPLPTGADLVWARLDGAPLREGWCHARLREADARQIVGDVTVLDDTGAPVWQARGFRLRLTPPRRRAEDGRLYEVRWQRHEPGPAALDPGRWLLVADEGSLTLARSLSARLTRAGAHCALAGPSAGSAAVPGAGEAALAAAEAGGPLRGVVDTRAAAPGRSAAVGENLRRRGEEALHLIQAVAGRAWRHDPPRLWLLTAGSCGPVGAGEQTAPVAAVVRGLARTAANEIPGLGCSLVDLDRPESATALEPVAALLLAADPPVEAAVRDDRLVVPRLGDVPPSPRSEVPGIRPDRTYVVTGGLGALGLRVARWLAGCGARHMLLLARGTPSAAAARQVAELSGTGRDIRVATVDVADADALRRALKAPEGGPAAQPPIGGVFHLAGVLEDALLPNLDAAALGRAFAGKAAGAWHLHELTLGEPVELFVLFSSLAGLIGSPGQAAYAAANAFLDDLACRRAAAGLPGMSISWGPWGGGSLAETGGGVGRLAARGVPPLDPDAGIGLLEEAVRCDRPHLAASAFAPRELVQAGLWRTARGLLAPLLAPLMSGAGAAPDAAGEDDRRGAARRGALRQELRALPTRTQRRQTMFTFVTDQVRQVLGAGPGGVAPDVPFQTLGFDSLMAIELRGRLEAALGIRLSATLVYACPTADALTDRLLTLLGPALGPAGDGPARPPAAQPAGPGAAVPPQPAPPGTDLTHLDDSEVAALLAAELEAFEAETKR